uniref:Uncharacterized protein n=1 Tax=Branchiostoma floridae TaxID=7739 RepID=C3Z7Z4_BRAFL|eukprot:XP_002595296.1 hypothetical protein BRAFLDRAFT_128105 [Branchiostoma floridae]
MESEEDAVWLLPPEKRTRTSVATSKTVSPSSSATAVPPVPVCRSKTISFDFSKCIFCRKQTHKKVKDLINVSTFEACQRIVEAAHVKEDGELLRILGAFNNDLIAAEAKYHKACQASYTSKSNLKVASGKASDGFSQAFRDLLDEVQPHLDSGRAFTMSALLDRYKTNLEKRSEDSKSYTKYHLKAKLQGHFGASIAFHVPYDRSMSELVYSSSVCLEDVLDAAYRTPTAVPTATDDAQQSKSAQATEGMDKDLLLYHAAMAIKSDISNATGIQTQPISVADMTLATCRSVVPDSLFKLLQHIITVGHDDTPSDQERKILMLAQDIMHCASYGRIKTPKHTCLGLTVRHLTRSKQLLTILNRMGHCASYDEIEVVDTSLATECIAKADIYGVVVPSNIKPGTFVQAAADNNDLSEETLDGKNTTHATTLVLFQRGTYGPAPRSQTLGDHSVKKKSLTSSCATEILDFSACGKRPAVTTFLNKVGELIGRQEDHDSICTTAMVDMEWVLMRMLPTKLVDVSLHQNRPDQSIPGWSGFHAAVTSTFSPHMLSTVIGYCPMIQGSPTEYSTVYTVMKQVQAMMKHLDQEDSVITFDLAIYSMAKEIQWRLPEEFSDTVIRLGGFHIALNYLSLLGKQYKGSGLDDLLLESGVYGSNTATILLEGKSYNRGVRAHKLTMEVMLRLQWQAYISSVVPEGGEIPPDVEEEVSAVQLAYERAGDLHEPMTSLHEAMPALMTKFEHFKTSMKAKSHLFSFWDNYVSMVLLLLQFIKAERSGDWSLHLASTACMVPCFNSMDRTNYARWLPVYLADMRRLPETHPQVHNAFMAGDHAISRSNQPFAKVWTDMALEQSINLDSKTSGGIVGISQRPGALERWFATVHERVAVVTALKEMCGIADSDLIATHKEARDGRVKRDEDDVRKMRAMFEVGLMTNPFCADVSQDIHPLINFATGVVMPEDAAVRLISAYEIGLQQCSTFVRQRLDSNEKGFWEPLPHLKIKTFHSLSQKRRMTTNEKVVTISADRDLFGRLVIAARSRQIDLKEVLTYELCAVPLSLVHPDGTMRKTCKSVLLSELEKEVQVHARLPVTNDISTAYISDGMATIQAVGTGGAALFGDLATLHYRMLTSNLGQQCQRVDVVFDQYNKTSIKDGERQRRDQQSTLEVKIQGHTTPTPKQWKKYVANPKNKENLSEYLTQSFCELGMSHLQPGQKIVVGGGLEDGQRAIMVTNNHTEDLKCLYSDHEEADTRILLHVQDAARECRRIVVNSPDTDVAVLCTSFCSELGCDELWFRTGVKDKARYIPVHSLSQSLGPQLCQALPAFHAITGCDSTGSFHGIGKKKALSVLRQNPEHQSNLAVFGQEPKLGEECFRSSENFVCDLYESGKAPCTTDELRYFIFCQKKQRNEALPPTSNSLRHHLQRLLTLHLAGILFKNSRKDS